MKKMLEWFFNSLKKLFSRADSLQDVGAKELLNIETIGGRMKLLKFHFRQLITVACTDGKFSEEEENFIIALLKDSYLIRDYDKEDEEAEITGVCGHVYYMGFETKKEFKGLASKFYRDIEEDIKNAKGGKCRRDIEESDNIYVDAIKKEYLLARRFVTDMLQLAYSDDHFSRKEVKYVKRVAGMYGISGEDFANALASIERAILSPVKRISLGYWDKNDFDNVVYLAKRASLWFFKGSSRRVVFLVFIVALSFFSYANLEPVSLPGGSLQKILFNFHQSIASLFRSHGGLSEIIQQDDFCGSKKLMDGALVYLLAQTVTVLFVLMLMFAYFGKNVLNDSLRRYSIVKRCKFIKVVMSPISLFLKWGKFKICCKSKIYVIWGFSKEGLSLAADVKRMEKHSVVIFMLNEDTISTDEDNDITKKLQQYGCRWKKTSFSDMDGFDGIGDYHFVISTEGRENRVLAQRIIDKMMMDKKGWKRCFYPERSKPQIYVRIKHSNFADLAEWLNNSVIRKYVDLRVFRDSDIVADNFIEAVEYRNATLFGSSGRSTANVGGGSGGACVGKYKNILFFGMGTNGRAILEKLLASGRLGDNAIVTIFESDEENRRRSVYYIKSVLNTIYWDLYPRAVESDKCYELREPLKGYGRFTQWLDWRLTYINESGKECRITMRFIVGDYDVKGVKFKEWAWRCIFNDKSNEGGNKRLILDFAFDLVVSCLGDDHDSMKVMRRIDRVWESKFIGKEQPIMPSGKYFIQLDDMEYSIIYGRYINKSISMFGDYRSIYNNQLIFQEIIVEMAGKMAEYDTTKDALINKQGDWKWDNITYSYQYKYINMAKEIIERLRRKGLIVRRKENEEQQNELLT